MTKQLHETVVWEVAERPIDGVYAYDFLTPTNSPEGEIYVSAPTEYWESEHEEDIPFGYWMINDLTNEEFRYDTLDEAKNAVVMAMIEWRMS